MPKKFSSSSIHRSHGGDHKNENSLRLTTLNKDNKSSVMQSDSNPMSNMGGLASPKLKRISADNLSATNNNVESEPTVDHSKHISFAIEKDNDLINIDSPFLVTSLVDSDENKDIVNMSNNSSGKTKKVSVEVKNSQEDPSPKNQKRSSISKPANKRTSIKFRDRANRTNSANQNSYSTGFSIRRRQSRSSISFNDGKEESFNAPLSMHEDASVISEERSTNYITGNVNTTSHTNIQSQFSYDNTSQLTNDICEVDEIDFNRCFPWIKVIVKLLHSVNYECKHNVSNHSSEQTCSKTPINFRKCDNDCYLKLHKSSHCLIEAVLRIYESQIERNPDEISNKKNESDLNSSKSKTITKSDALSYKFRKSSQFSMNSQKIAFLSQINKKSHTRVMGANNDGVRNNEKKFSIDNLKSNPLTKNKIKKIATIEYIGNQVFGLNQIPLLILCKSVLVMPDDLFINLVRITWNLLLDSDQELASSAGKLIALLLLFKILIIFI